MYLLYVTVLLVVWSGLVQDSFDLGCNLVSVYLVCERFRSKHPTLMIIIVSEATQIYGRGGEGKSSV